MVIPTTESAHHRAWNVADAKAHLSELLEHVTNDGPQVITRSGEQIAEVVSIEWHRRTKRSGSLAEFLAASSLRDSDLEVDRVDTTTRDSACTS
jgi:prevent-host-death family protein